MPGQDCRRVAQSSRNSAEIWPTEIIWSVLFDVFDWCCSKHVVPLISIQQTGATDRCFQLGLDSGESRREGDEYLWLLDQVLSCRLWASEQNGKTVIKVGSYSYSRRYHIPICVGHIFKTYK